MAGAVHLVDHDMASHTSHHPRYAAWLETAIFVCLAAVALCAPISTKGAVNSFRAATVLWLILLCTGKRRPAPQPLTVPLILFLALTAISSLFSTDPFLSWGRMRTVSLLFLAVVAGQSIRSMRQLKILAALLIGSCLLTVIYTGWQYTAGIGVQAVANGPALASLQRFGLAPGDIIRKLGGTTIRSPRRLLTQKLPPGRVELLLWRETPNALQPFRISVDAKTLQTALHNPGITLTRAHPPRAQGFFKHYFPFSEILVFIGLLIGGFALSGVPVRKLRITLIVAFLATAAVLALTLTRISLVSLVLGTLLIVVMRDTRRIRWISVAGFLMASLVAIAWVQHHRKGPESDPGTEYRLLMWRDSIKMIGAHPILGVGLDSVAGDWQRWGLEAYRRFGLHSHFHSTPIQLAVECGLPALGVWIWLMWGYGIFLVRQLRHIADGDWFARGLVVGALGGLSGFVLTGLLQYNFGDAEAMIVFWLLVGLTFALNRMATQVPGREVPVGSQHPSTPSVV
jgi:O-antigen ligase